ncbi:RNA helicase [Cyanobium sp. BA20m-14]|uniref:RNA helicase n=1 Tax=Cyanobium sp. BA20m-14 TaxID=2823703 RepID=UPI0020CDE4AD|nr:RNA helicase [Cyanobium sp. BA20m-14]MCP9913497.1 RNA helicase [Cyanobium sp. BA20m-14]
MADSWSEPLEQGFDRLVSTGRQLVNGVSGARPGARGSERRQRGPLLQSGLGKLDGLGRWVEGKLDWILEDGEELREPWQDSRPAAPRRQPLEAISRRSGALPEARQARQAPQTSQGEPDVWPDDTDFVVPRWQRQAPGPARAEPQPPTASPSSSPAPGRAMPRSSRRRSGTSSSWSD